MAVRIWDAPSTNEWSTAGNWSGDTVPIAGDEIVFDGTSVRDVIGGMLPSEIGNRAYDLIHVKDGYTGKIGTVDEPLVVGTAGGNEITVIFEGGVDSELHLMVALAADDAANDSVLPRVICNSNGGTLYLYSLANDGANTGTFTDVFLFQGTLALALEAHTGIIGDATGPVVTNLYMVPKNNKGSNAICTAVIDSYKVNGPSYTNVYMQNGTLTTNNGIGILHLKGGIVHLGTDGDNGTNVDIVTDLIMTGGTLNWNPNEDSAYIAKGHIFGGAIQCSKTINEGNSRYLGSGANKNIYVYAGAVLNLVTGRGSVNVNPTSKLINLGGTIITDSVTDLSIAYNPDLGS